MSTCIFRPELGSEQVGNGLRGPLTEENSNPMIYDKNVEKDFFQFLAVLSLIIIHSPQFPLHDHMTIRRH